ncbi:unnamed protein product [Bursaphelenchus xylophilus]|uniref:(pine wood nematode) hypothetical protein n=1 Tax=Bursaphelenchus xylophilus TaxID=6326 RepID=A0A1I7ST13_BURXY|nr:unnamed protein product [Bursaphelenchus xylophilus]CAG9108801.1 unnamed protein product [Bursaphelenchus xylophilus]
MSVFVPPATYSEISARRKHSSVIVKFRDDSDNGSIQERMIQSMSSYLMNEHRWSQNALSPLRKISSYTLSEGLLFLPPPSPTNLTAQSFHSPSTPSSNQWTLPVLQTKEVGCKERGITE